VTTKEFKMEFHRATRLELDGYNYIDPTNMKQHYEQMNQPAEGTSVTEGPILGGYADSSNADCKDTSKSSAGHVFFLGNGQAAVEVIAKMLPHVGLSSTENEYVTLSRCGVAGFYLKQFLDELGLFPKPLKMKIHEDNNATLNALKKNVAVSKFRHVRMRYHYLRDMVRDGVIQVHKVHTDDQVADLFTKPMFGEKLVKFTKQILGHAPRNHEDGGKVDMDYQPHLVEDSNEPTLSRTDDRLLASAGIT